jgi:transposase-like protein
LPGSNITLRDLAAFARYLLALDDYSLSLVQDVLSGKATINEIAQERGVSRQYAHRRVLQSIVSHPELSVLYMTLMPKLTAARRRHLRDNARSKPKNKEKKK